MNQTDHGVTSTMELGLVPLMLTAALVTKYHRAEYRGQWGDGKTMSGAGRLVDIDEIRGVRSMAR